MIAMMIFLSSQNILVPVFNSDYSNSAHYFREGIMERNFCPQHYMYNSFFFLNLSFRLGKSVSFWFSSINQLLLNIGFGNETEMYFFWHSKQSFRLFRRWHLIQFFYFSLQCGGVCNKVGHEASHREAGWHGAQWTPHPADWGPSFTL